MRNWFLHSGLVYRDGALHSEDILVIDGKIVAFGEQAASQKANFSGQLQEIDVSDMLISRGFIDLHVHLREPGGEVKETIATGTKAAAAGGFTSVFAMPNTNPVLDSIDTLNNFQELVEKNAVIKVEPIAALTLGRKNQQLVDFSQLTQAGVKFFTDDGDPICDALVEEAMIQLAKIGGALVNHLEDPAYVGEGFFHQAIPAESEYLMLERDLQLVEKTKCPYHAAHLSCAQSVELIAEAKAKGLPVTAEVTPHHLLLTYEDISFPEGHFQMKPPLRSPEDRYALIEGLRTGIIDIIATDHAPHGKEKEKGLFFNSPFGVTGLETAFPALYTYLVKTDVIKLEQLLDAFTVAPAQISGQATSLRENMTADLVVIDLLQQRSVKQSSFFSKGTNSPFIGHLLEGWPVLTLVNGEVRYACQNTMKGVL